MKVRDKSYLAYANSEENGWCEVRKGTYLQPVVAESGAPHTEFSDSGFSRQFKFWRYLYTYCVRYSPPSDCATYSFCLVLP